MPAKLVREGATRLLSILLGSTPPDAKIYLGLYKNAIEPSYSARLINIQEVLGSGYVRFGIPRGTWQIDGNVAINDIVTFLAEAGDWGNVTGCFYATSSGNTGVLIAVEHFEESYYIEAGKGVKITPKISLE